MPFSKGPPCTFCPKVWFNVNRHRFNKDRHGSVRYSCCSPVATRRALWLGGSRCRTPRPPGGDEARSRVDKALALPPPPLPEKMRTAPSILACLSSLALQLKSFCNFDRCSVSAFCFGARFLNSSQGALCTFLHKGRHGPVSLPCCKAQGLACCSFEVSYGTALCFGTIGVFSGRHGPTLEQQYPKAFPGFLTASLTTRVNICTGST